VSDDKLDTLTAELRAIDFWDQLSEGATLMMNEIDRAGGFEARRMRRLEIIDEIDGLLTKEIKILTERRHGTPLSA
jgi:hypothetical protein